MKLGSENRNAVIIAAVLGIVALLMVWRTFFSGGGPVIASNAPAPVQTSTPTNAGPPAEPPLRNLDRQ